MAIKDLEKEILEYLASEGGKVDIFTFWWFYNKLGVNRMKAFANLRKKGLAKYVVKKGTITDVVLTEKGEKYLIGG